MLSQLCTEGKDSQVRVIPQWNVYLLGHRVLAHRRTSKADRCSSGFSSTRGLAPVSAMLGYRPQRMQSMVPGRVIGVNLKLG